MLVPLVNEPRDYAWGSQTLIAELEGRAPSGRPEAEIWFGDHPADPALVPDGRPLGEWLATEGTAAGAPATLPYLLKLLAAASPLSIQAHPTKAQAEAGFAREEAAGIARDAPDRTYRDANHKPELIVVVSETFSALAGLRDLDTTRRLIARLGEAAAPLAARLQGTDAAASLRETIAWLLSGARPGEVRAVIDAAVAATPAPGDEFAAELALAGRLDRTFPGDPGVLVALLMNLVELRRGEALFLPAGVLHAYLEGLGVELMAASDNVLRGGLTPKHIDVAELLEVLDPTPGPPPMLVPEDLGAGAERFAADVPDFALLRVRLTAGAPVDVRLEGVSIALATRGEIEIVGGTTGERTVLTPGRAALVTADERMLHLDGRGELFIAMPGV